MSNDPETPSDRGLILARHSLVLAGLELAESMLARGEAAGPEAQAEITRLERLRARAEKGDADAQYELGQLIREISQPEGRIGPGLLTLAGSKDIAEIVAYLDHGQLDRALEESQRQAAHWFQKAAAQGHTEAAFNLGNCLRESCNPDEAAKREEYRQAVRWYRMAAESGHAKAQMLLGSIYAEGQGIERDTAESQRWFRAAALAGNFTALYFAAKESRLEERSDADLTRAFLSCASAAAEGDLVAQRTLGMIYQYGANQDLAASRKWIQTAARGGDVTSQFVLALQYAFGIFGTESSPQKALYWFEKAAGQGLALAQCEVAERYLLGTGVERDAEKALLWFDRAQVNASTHQPKDVAARFAQMRKTFEQEGIRP